MGVYQTRWDCGEISQALQIKSWKLFCEQKTII